MISNNVYSQDSKGIWINYDEIARLPTSGKAWDNLKAEADKSTGAPNVSNQNDDVNVRVLAKAFVYARTRTEKYRTEVIDACMTAIGTEKGGRTLALGRELIAYIIAADLVGLSTEQDQRFRAWIQETRTEELSGRTLISTHEDRPNNWGTHAGGTRIAIAAYLGDQAEIERCAKVFKGWLGDRSTYDGFTYGSLSWQSDPNNPVGINPKGATKNGHSVDGVLPDDQRRGGSFRWPPPKENYVYEALQGVFAQAVILYRLGYDVWNWEDKAMLRAFQWLHNEANYQTAGDDTWEPHIINYYYDTNFPAPIPSKPGKNVGWTDWTHTERKDGGNGNTITYISGKILNAITNIPVQSATVKLMLGNEVRYQKNSDSLGLYSFYDIEAGTYKIECTREGYEDWTGSVTVEQGQHVSGYNVNLNPITDTLPPQAPKNVKAVSGNN